MNESINIIFWATVIIAAIGYIYGIALCIAASKRRPPPK